MGTVIASSYEIIKEIGSGGGGVVYLGRHLRLGIDLVLKADKRTLSAKPETLQREVEALKNLHNTYIPRVYDFVAQGGVAYTVMDYIPGESLDKPLGRGERFPQPQVIGWACQLLEAIDYLHSVPPYGILHGDIKPANVMVTPEGDVRLIDFNIALALGEEGAVQVGFSRGYASPEHYGLDYRSHQGQWADSPETEISSLAETRLSGESQSSKYAPVRLDTRSDIYSLGATLYHLFSGIKPPQDAKAVRPLTVQNGVSPAVAAIVTKSMDPNPDERYQSAREMLWDFTHLWEQDSRTRAHRRRRNITAGILATLFLTGGACTLGGQRLMTRAQAAAAEEARRAEEVARKGEEKAREAEQKERQAKEEEARSKDALAALREGEEALSKGDLPLAKARALGVLDLDNPYHAQGQKLLTDALGVYDLSDGLKARCVAELPSEALKVALSPNGIYGAALYAYHVAVVDMATGETVADLPAQETAVSGLVFPNDATLLYAGVEGVTAYDLAANAVLWQGEPATRLALSADGKRVACVMNDAAEAVVYDTATGQVVNRVSFQGRKQSMPAGGGILADPGDVLLALNRDGSLLAASFDDGSVHLFDVSSGEDSIALDPSENTHFEGGFSQNIFAFSAQNGGNSVCYAYDVNTRQGLLELAGNQSSLTRVDETGVYVAAGGLLVRLDIAAQKETPLAQVPGDILQFVRGDNGYVLVAYDKNGYALFNDQAQLVTQGVVETGCEFLGFSGQVALLGSLETPELRIMELVSHPEADLASYDASLPHLETRLSGDGKTIMLFQYDRFYLLDSQGTLLCDVEIPNSDQVYDTQYRRDADGSRLEVTYYSGLTVAYSAADGSVLWEKDGPEPDTSLEETFETEKWRIVAPLHTSPVVYDKATGQEAATLEKDSYLMYVTEVGDYIITQYLSSDGEPYGLLLDQNLETLARIPALRDVVDGTLVLDDGSGNLRQCRIYSLSELIALAE